MAVLATFIIILNVLAFSIDHLNSFATAAPGTTTSSQKRDNNTSAKIKKILDDIFESGYDRRVRPGEYGPAVEVNIGLYVSSLDSASEVGMDFTSGIFLVQSWMDTRLAFKSLPGIDSLIVGPDVAEKIWMPDTYFSNEKPEYTRSDTGIPLSTFLQISSRGDVVKSTKLLITVACELNLRDFPMDDQTCSLEMESHSYSMSEIRYRWRDNSSLALDPEVDLPPFQVTGYNQIDTIVAVNSGNYTRIIAQIHFSRQLDFYLTDVYIPTCLIVFMSYVSFWITGKADAVPARVNLCVTALLTLSTQHAQSQKSLPPVSYVKAIDVFMTSCTIFVFGSLVEYAIINVQWTEDERMNKNKSPGKQKHRSLSVDRFSRWFFPFFFVVLNIIYWLTYLTD